MHSSREIKMFLPTRINPPQNNQFLDSIALTQFAAFPDSNCLFVPFLCGNPLVAKKFNYSTTLQPIPLSCLRAFLSNEYNTIANIIKYNCHHLISIPAFIVFTPLNISLDVIYVRFHFTT